jgi:hypothetical protein
MQTDYDNMAPAVQGSLGDSGFHDIVSRVASEAIPFGRGIVVASDGTVALPSSDTEEFAGVAVHKEMATPNDDGSAEYAEDDDVLVLRRGTVWVYCEQAVDPTKDVYVRTGDEYQGHRPGDFRTDNDAESDPQTLQITNARWANKTTAAGLALLELNLP